MPIQDTRLKLDGQLPAVIERERARLWRFIRSRIPDRSDAEDILQEVFYEFVEAYHLMQPIQHAGGWMFQVARNRITDWFRKKRPVALADMVTTDADGGTQTWEDLLPSPAAGPDAVFARGVLINALLTSIDELPPQMREVFIAHEVDGRGFKEISLATGVNVNTLISRKHQAVLQLRRRLQSVYDEFNQSESSRS